MSKYTFTDLLEKKCFPFSKIEIPILQRDYVQGQKSKEDSEQINKTGFRFINAIFESMKNGNPMDMDFIYGSVENKNFIPLDGQQRLTTLFLLHWYFACKDFRGDELKEKLELLSNFSYETRISSREFCSELCRLEKKFDINEIPSGYIQNESWFFNKFKLDPTVSSMLNMLDVIHKLDSVANVSYEKLSLLQFDILNMDNFGLSESLYLKMNARGKELTDFEKIKAELEKLADDSKWEEGVAETEKFYYKADRTWTDLFWNNFNSSTDEAFLNFISEIIITCQTLKIENLETESGKQQVRKIQRLASNSENLSVEDFTKDSFTRLKKILDLYSGNENDTKNAKINFWEFCKKEKNFFRTICTVEDKSVVTYPVRCLFFAQTLYLENAEFSEESFSDWMRVIRNIAENATVDTVQTFKGFLNLIQELSAGCDDIYKYLSEHNVESNFAKAQVQEEIYKAKIIVKEKTAKALFCELEENPFCKGKLYFPLYCCDANFQKSNLDIELFKKVKSVFDDYFSEDDISDDFRVLLFTCGDNSFYQYWGGWAYATETIKRCCIKNTADLNGNFARIECAVWRKDILKEAVAKLLGGTKIEKILSEYECPKNMPKWKKWIIKNPRKFAEHCINDHYFGITGDNKECYLYNGYQRPPSLDVCFKIPIK